MVFDVLCPQVVGEAGKCVLSSLCSIVAIFYLILIRIGEWVGGLPSAFIDFWPRADFI